MRRDGLSSLLFWCMRLSIFSTLAIFCILIGFIFIKGVVLGNVSVTYELPILTTGKYASAKVSFVVAEVDPYSADTIQVAGSFRGLSTSLERNVYKNPSKGGLV